MSCNNALTALGVTQDDVVTLYLPLIPELAITMLACTRIGVMHNVVFAGFSPHALASRINDCKSRFVITADSGMRRAKEVPLKVIVDEALDACPSVLKTVVFRHNGNSVRMQSGRDIEWSTFGRRLQRRACGSSLRRRAPALLALHIRQYRQAQEFYIQRQATWWV